jgi:hypothetical protein
MAASMYIPEAGVFAGCGRFMKLSIQGSSLWLRVTQKEVAQLRHSGRVESSIELAPGWSTYE